MRTILSPVLTLGLLLGLQAPAHTQTAVGRPAASPDFPPIDRGVGEQHRNALKARQRAALPRAFPDRPSEALQLIAIGDSDQRLRGLRAVVDRYPTLLRAALDTAGIESWFADPASDPLAVRRQLQEVTLAAQARLVDLPREEAAQIALRLIPLAIYADGSGNDGHKSRFEQFVQDYAGTEAAAMGQVVLILVSPDRVAQPAALDRFIEAHPGTVAAARALHDKAFQIAHTPSYQRGGADPLGRFTQVADAVAALESGAYPPSEWTARAPDLLFEFSTFNSTYGPGSLDLTIDGFQRFSVRFMAANTGPEVDARIAFLVGWKMGELFQRRGDGLAGVDGAFAALARVDSVRARYLQAEFYISRMMEEQDRRTTYFEKARTILTTLAGDGGEPYRRRALAALASLHFRESDYARAEELYRRYVRLYSRSDFAWLAAIRIGRCRQQLGDWLGARRSYLAAATDYADGVMARVLGHAYAARAAESLELWDAARRDYQVAAGDSEKWSTFSLNERRLKSLADRTPDGSLVARESVLARLTALGTVDQPGGRLLARGRWLLEADRQREALVHLETAARQFPASVVGAQARYLANRARVEIGLALADADMATRDEAAAHREWDQIAGGPYDFGVSAMKIARATLLWRQGSVREAHALMGDALREWRREQDQAPRQALNAIEADIAAIRAMLFRPTGSPDFGGIRLNGFSWPASAPDFSLVSADVRVTQPGAEATTYTVHQSFSALDGVLFLSAEDLALLDRIITRLGGSRTRTPTAVMEVPNQPAGPSTGILRFWSQYFPVRPGHWGGWDLLTAPVITGLDFVDAERTQVIVHVTIGYGGGTLLLSKQGGVWRLTRLVSSWVT